MPVSKMKISMGVISLLTVAATAGAQTPTDQYNPRAQRDPAASSSVVPSLADMGFGTDEGNMGPFVTMTDKQYAQAMAVRGMMEVRLGEAAIEKSERADVKDLAHRLVNDYLGWDSGMDKAAKKLGIPLPSDLNDKQKAEVDRICALSGPGFDQAYLKEVVKLQQKALTMSHHEASEAAVSGFRHWAGVVIPQLQDQVQLAQKALDAGTTVVSRK